MEDKNYIRKYYDQIISDKIKVSKHIRMLYNKVINELDHPKDGYYFDLAKATHPITFIEKFCKQSKGKWMGKPIELLLWQKAMIQVIYGFVNSDGLRRVREVFVICGRKNGKSVLLSALSLYDLCTEQGAQVACASTKKDAARIVFEETRNMIAQSPYLSKHIRKRKFDLYMDSNFGTMTPLASDSNSLDGLNLSFCCCDELAAWKARNLYDVLKQSQSARQQPLMFSISTCGFKLDNSIYNSLYDHGCGVLEGSIIDDAFLAFYYEMDNEEQIENESLWEMANPSIDVIKSRDELRSNVERSKTDPTFRPTLLIKDFNIPTQTSLEKWLDFDVINQCYKSFDIEDFRGGYAIGSQDLSLSGDLTCLNLILQHRNNVKKYIYQHYFLPKDQLEKHKNDGVPYALWEEQGHISFCDGNKIVPEDIVNWWIDCVNKLGIVPILIGQDPWGTVYIDRLLKERGFKTEDVRQGYKTISPAMKDITLEFEAGNIIYCNPILKWCLSNTILSRDPADNWKYDKSKNKNLRIDGAASLVTGWSSYMNHKQDFQNMIK